MSIIIELGPMTIVTGSPFLSLALDTAIELTRWADYVVFVTIYDSAGKVVARVPALPARVS